MTGAEPPGAQEHYLDGADYDRAYRRYRRDAAFYEGLGRASGGPVLELGVGTGRIALALAKRGIDVVGVDRSASMLRRARARLAKASRRVSERVSLRQEDLRTVQVRRRFPLVIAPFNVFMHLYTRADVERALSTCHRHLERDGCLAFDVLMPDVKALSRDPDRLYRCRPVRRADGRRYRYAERFDYDRKRQIQTVTGIYEPPDDPDGAFSVRLVQRQFFPSELRALLHYNDFDVLRHEGGFGGQPLDDRADSQVFVARRR